MTDRKEPVDEEARRRRAERLLGDLLPEQTRDDSAEGWGEGWGDRGDQASSTDDELRRNVPPHHVD